MNSNRTTVSIGMPVYNAERYLRAALDSLLSQTYRDFELLISDNASEDGTEEICREYAARDSRVSYHRQDTNRGAIWNCNHTVELATGRYFKWAADDDVHDATFLEKCVQLLESRAEITWCHTQTLHIDSAGNIIPAETDPNIPAGATAYSLLPHTTGSCGSSRASDSVADRFESVLLGTTWCADSFGLVRIEALRSTKLLLPCYGSEKVLMGELSLRGKYAEIPEVLFFERVHGEASAALRTAADQQTFVLGSGRRGFAMTRWRLLAGHMAAVAQAPVSLGVRMKCAWALTRYVCQFRKWKRILSQSVRRIGVGAETRTDHETAPMDAAGTL